MNPDNDDDLTVDDDDDDEIEDDEVDDDDDDDGGGGHNGHNDDDEYEARKGGRQRVPQFTVAQLAPFFEVPMHDAARQLGVSATALKRNTDRLGLAMWPYRRFRSLKRSIDDVNEKLRLCRPDDAARLEAHHEALRNLHTKLQHLRAHPLQQNHIVARTKRQKTPAQCDMAAGLGISVRPRSFEHGLEALVLLLHTHAQHSFAMIQAGPPVQLPEPRAAHASEPPASPALARSAQPSVAASQRSAFARVAPTPALSASSAAIGTLAGEK